MLTIKLGAAGKCLAVVLSLAVISLILLRSGPHVSSKTNQPTEQDEERSSQSLTQQGKEINRPSTVSLHRQTQVTCGLQQDISYTHDSEGQGDEVDEGLDADEERNRYSLTADGDEEVQNVGGEDPEVSNQLWGTTANQAPSCRYLNEIGYLSAEYWIRASKAIKPQKLYCDVNHFCDGLAGGWTRVAHLDMNERAHKCPPNWRELKAPKRSCGRKQDKGRVNGAGCSAALFSPPLGMKYDRVCGRVFGYQYCNTMAFWNYYHKISTSINEPFLDGVTIARLQPSVGTDREHVWSFVSALHSRYSGIDAICSCTNPNHYHKHRNHAIVPPWVDNHYFCETGSVEESPPRTSLECIKQHDSVFYATNRLWDGEGCNNNSTCCDFNRPPWFCRKLEKKSDMPLEVRICGSGYVIFGDTPIELMELYVQ